MYGFRGVGLSEVQLSISELSVVGGWVVVGGAQTHFMVGPSQGPTKKWQRSYLFEENEAIFTWTQSFAQDFLVTLRLPPNMSPTESLSQHMIKNNLWMREYMYQDV